MTDPSTSSGQAAPSELDLMAYADGELAPAAQERVRQYLAESPAAEAKVNLHNKLQQASRHAMGEVAVPAHLRAALEELATPVRTTRWRIGPLRAVAALLVVALVGGVMVWMNQHSRTPVVAGSSVVPVAWVSTASHVHIDCASHAAHFAAGFPRSLTELPESLRSYLGHSARCPDLAKLGYTFQGCGPCTIPGGKTAHLLYKSVEGHKPLSLFVQNDAGQLALDGKKVYLSRDPADGTEMIIWRGDGVVYYLVGENDTQLTSAADEMGMKLRI
jgi:anti-sigma factor RsiW